MANPAEAPIDKELLQTACQNYYHNLNLQPETQVLIITDKLPKRNPQLRKELINDLDPNIIIRRKLASLLEYKIRAGGNEVASVDFDGKTTEEEFQSETKRAIEELGDNPTTIVYLGESWSNRDGTNQAVNSLRHSRSVLVTGFLGLTTEDLHIPLMTNFY